MVRLPSQPLRLERGAGLMVQNELRQTRQISTPPAPALRPRLLLLLLMRARLSISRRTPLALYFGQAQLDRTMETLREEYAQAGEEVTSNRYCGGTYLYTSYTYSSNHNQIWCGKTWGNIRVFGVHRG